MTGPLVRPGESFQKGFSSRSFILNVDEGSWFPMGGGQRNVARGLLRGKFLSWGLHRASISLGCCLSNNWAVSGAQGSAVVPMSGCTTRAWRRASMGCSRRTTQRTRASPSTSLSASVSEACPGRVQPVPVAQRSKKQPKAVKSSKRWPEVGKSSKKGGHKQSKVAKSGYAKIFLLGQKRPESGQRE